MEPMCNDLVILSIIGQYNENANFISAVMCEKSKKPSFLTFFGPKRIPFHLKLPFLFRRTSYKQMGDYLVNLSFIGEVQ